MALNENKMEQYIKVPTNEKEKGTKYVQPDIPAHFGYGIRHVQLVIFFICISICFVARGHLGVTMVAMTTHHSNKPDNVTDVTNNVRNVTNGNETEFWNGTIDSLLEEDVEWTIYRTYNWNKPIQEMVLSSFFLGYFLMMFPIALVCQRWGGKVPIQIALLINGIVSIMTPWLTLWGGWKAVCACRVMQGLSQAGTFPGLQTLLANWVPANERASLSSYVYTGTTVGTVIGFQLAGILAEIGGWPCTFWVVGILCILAFVFLTFLGASTPMEHSSITDEERNFIRGHYDTVVQKQRKAPWMAIATSKPMWGNFLTHIGSGVAFVFFLTQVPSYIHYILGINVKSSGILSSLPYVASFFTSLSFGVVSDYFTNKELVSIINARRISNTISQVGVAVSLICASFATSPTVCVICFVVTMGCHNGIHTGWMVNHMDLAPNYSGTLMALGSTLMNAVIILMPVLVSNIVVDVTNPFQWRIMLFLVAGIAFLTNIVFVVFISTDVQPWNEGVLEDEDAELTTNQLTGKENKQMRIKK